MSGATFVALYAITGTIVGLSYFTHQRWDAFFARHSIEGEGRGTLRLHLTVGAAAVGAAWPVALLFALYAALWPLVGRAGGRAANRVSP
jgi:hypothetical protein